MLVTDGTYYCDCKALGWTNSADWGACEQQADPCDTGDPCNSAAAAANVCSNNFDGSFMCRCGSEDFAANPAGTACFAVPNPCRDGDRCLGDDDNKCVNNKDGTYYCDCGGDQWERSEDWGTCERVVSPCRGFPCSEHLDSRNSCVAGPEGGYSCECGIGWTPRSGGGVGGGCRRLENACKLDICLQTQDINNVCHYDELSGEATCTCGGAGFEALAKTMDSFVQKQSDVAGVVVEAGAEAEEAEAVREGDVEIDGDKFASILAGLVGGDMRGGGGGGGGGGLDFSDDEDGEDGEGERGEQGEEELAMEEELQKGGVLREGDVNVDVSVVEGLMQSLLEEEGGTGPASTLLKQMNIK
jgi:hypothetical protein